MKSWFSHDEGYGAADISPRSYGDALRTAGGKGIEMVCCYLGQSFRRRQIVLENSAVLCHLTEVPCS